MCLWVAVRLVCLFDFLLRVALGCDEWCCWYFGVVYRFTLATLLGFLGEFW